MDSKAAEIIARREARKKRILENSTNRLGRIRGEPFVENADEPIPTLNLLNPDVIHPDPEYERDIYVGPLGSQITPGVNDEQQFIELLNSLQSGDGGLPNGPFGAGGAVDFAAFSNSLGGDADIQNNPMFASLFGTQQQQQTPKQPDTVLTKILKSKIHIALLAILTYILITVAPYSSNVFLLFLLWEIVEMFILKEYETNGNGLVSAFCIMAGMSPVKLNVAIKWIQLINKVLRDIAIFLFFFILSHIIHLNVIGISIHTLLQGEMIR